MPPAWRTLGTMSAVRGCLALIPAALAASCALVAPLGGLTGGAGPDATSEGGPGVDTGSGDAPADASVDAPRDASSDTSSPQDATADTAPDAPPGADATQDVDAGATLDANDGATAETGTDATADAPASVYRAAVLADTPVGYWRLDETTGTTAHDESGNGRDATYVGAFTLGQPGALAGDPDPAVQLDGATGEVDVGSVFDFAPSLPFSFEAWVKPTTIDATYRHVVTKMQYTSTFFPLDGTYVVFVQGSPTLGFERWADAGTELAVESTTFTAVGTWAHVVATFDGTTGTLYVNGASVAAGTSLGGIAANSIPLAWGNLFAGSIDEVAVYDHALAQARVTAHYQAAQ